MINRHVVGYKRYICSNEAWKLARFLSVTWAGGQYIIVEKKKNRFHTDCLIFIVHSKKRRSWSTYPFLHVQRVPDFLRFLLPLLSFTKILWLTRIKFFHQWKLFSMALRHLTLIVLWKRNFLSGDFNFVKIKFIESFTFQRYLKFFF